MAFDPDWPLEAAPGFLRSGCPMSEVKPVWEEIADEPAAAWRNKVAE
jgi:hypothetical protein